MSAQTELPPLVTDDAEKREVLRYRRVLTETPLARQHEHVLEQKSTRKKLPIPWTKFDRAKYSAPALALAANAQKMLATGEYGAIGLFSRIAEALSIQGAPFDLIASAARIPSDEIRHADYAIRLAEIFAGEKVTLALTPESMDAPRTHAKNIGELDRLMVEVPAIGETLAGALLTACQRRASDPLAKAVFTSIIGDEVHHARLGWYYLAWRAPQWSRAERQNVADRAGELVMDVERRFWKGRDAPAGAEKAAKALGVLDSESQRATIAAVMEEEIVPALDALGLGASHAWRVRRRGGK